MENRIALPNKVLVADNSSEIVSLDLGLLDSDGGSTFVQVHEQAPAVPVPVLTGPDENAPDSRGHPDHVG